jgi:mRNA interferase RelE/StbE
MTWTLRLAREAEKQFKNLPADRQALVLKHLKEMQKDPLQGNVKPLKGKQWKGWYRRRVGDYRVVFSLEHTRQIINVAAILLRSEKTYR